MCATSSPASPPATSVSSEICPPTNSFHSSVSSQICQPATSSCLSPLFSTSTGSQSFSSLATCVSRPITSSDSLLHSLLAAAPSVISAIPRLETLPSTSAVCIPVPSLQSQETTTNSEGDDLLLQRATEVLAQLKVCANSTAKLFAMYHYNYSTETTRFRVMHAHSPILYY